MVLVFWFPNFLVTKILREGNLFVKKVLTTANSALVWLLTAAAQNFVIGTDLKELQHFGKRVAQ